MNTSTNLIKKCYYCGVLKQISKFNKNKSKSDGLSTECKECVKHINQKYRNNPKNNKKQKEYFKKYYLENKDLIISRSKENQEKNKESRKEYLKQYRIDNYDVIEEKRKIYSKVWNKENKDYYNQRAIKLRKENPLERLKHNLRNRTYNAFKRTSWNKNKGTVKLLGADYKTVTKHLESKFQDGMSWDNYGEWHLDHITPLNSAETKEELIKLFHYTNTQPLWAFDNLSKGSTIDYSKAI